MKQTEKKIEEGNKQAGVWVRASERLPVGTKKAINKATGEVGELIITENRAIFNSQFSDNIYQYQFNDKSLFENIVWLDEQPIPVNQDEKELWENIIVKIENAEFLKHKYIDTINELKSKYTIQLKSSPSPEKKYYPITTGDIDVQEGLREAAEEILHLHLCEQEGLSSGQPTPKQWIEAVNKLSDALK